MNLPTQLQQAVEQWASRQGISSEQFIIHAVAEKIDCLSQQLEPTSETPKERPPPPATPTFPQLS